MPPHRRLCADQPPRGVGFELLSFAPDLALDLGNQVVHALLLPRGASRDFHPAALAPPPRPRQRPGQSGPALQRNDSRLDAWAGALPSAEHDTTLS